jgi:hypothetical protein
MKTQTPWKQAVGILLCVETFLFTVGVLIHEAMHSLSFFVLSGRFGEIHIFDSVAYSYHTIGVCILPQGLVILNTTYLEFIAYGMTFLITGVFAFILIKLFYSDSKAKKSEMSPIC